MPRSSSRTRAPRGAWPRARCAATVAAAVLIAPAGPGTLRAQWTDPSLPEHTVLNPVAASRTPLMAIPYQRPLDGGWRVRAATVQYGNAIENESRRATGAGLLVDGEFLRAEVTVGRDLGYRGFVSATAGVSGAYAGFADGFFDWYHRLIGFEQPEREARPRNTFGYGVALPGGQVERWQPYTIGLTDVRLTAGYRWHPALQSAVTLTLPTATPAAGYGRGVPSVATVQTLRVRPLEWLVLESTAGVGVVPRHGALAEFQRTLVYSASSGLRIRLWAGNWIYGYVWYHSPYYRGTSLPSLDRREFTADFGWIFRNRRSGREWVVGLGEDVTPDDPGIDLILKISRRW